MKYEYPAIFILLDDEGVGVEFPDSAGTVTQGKDMKEALALAEDVLNVMLKGHEDRGEKVPTPSSLGDLHLEKGTFTAIIHADTDAYREMLKKQEQSKLEKVA